MTTPIGAETAPEPRSITVNMPAGKVAVPAWLASAFIESVFKHDRNVYGRHMEAVLAGEPLRAKPGAKKAQP